MGTDIHGFFQKYENNQWVDILDDYDQRRDYLLFEVLVNPRNHENITSIAPIRGLPDQFVVDEDNCYLTSNLDLWRSKEIQEIWEADDYLKIYLGDHSFSWLSGDEMLEWYSTSKINTVDGLIAYKDYPDWDRVYDPKFDYSLYLSNSIVLSEEQYKLGKQGDYVRVYWQQDIREYLSYFFDEVARLKSEHGKIRFIFGFDS